ncbi:NAD(P)H-binding protein [Mycobacterium sp. 21AC1]|uniref:NAD(P)H-binding protein n=1 Tax=[Mycobacterium] appelbergii TaxID=2939269 RepID=UPI002938E877|nr:NAD(P)H-binding protein [Mycobacterium sp. 21AC1]MDV3126496.1 NAD(P)H-binding protein [Mycobacterium sp. 21AC1]
MTILITGATGAIGASLVRRLSTAGHAVRAGSRNPEQAGLRDVEVVKLDLTAPDTFYDALKDVERIFLYAEPAAIGQFTESAERAGVRHIVLLSSDSVELTDAASNALAQHHALVEKSLVGTGFGTTVLRPGTFASMTLGWSRFIRSGTPVQQAFWDARPDIIHPEDIADVAERALVTNELDGSIIPLGGPELLTFREQLSVLGHLLGRELEYREPSREQAAAQLADHAPAPLIDAILDYWAHLPFDGKKATRSAERITGRPARTYRQWATEHLDSFR